MTVQTPLKGDFLNNRYINRYYILRMHSVNIKREIFIKSNDSTRDPLLKVKQTRFDLLADRTCDFATASDDLIVSVILRPIYGIYLCIPYYGKSSHILIFVFRFHFYMSKFHKYQHLAKPNWFRSVESVQPSTFILHILVKTKPLYRDEK